MWCVILNPTIWVCVLGLIIYFVSLAIYDAKSNSGCSVPAKVLAVLGSGGHTREMIAIMKSLSPGVFTPRVYVHSEMDNLSKVKADELEKSSDPESYRVRSIPRSREVGQSYVTSVFTTLFSFLASFVIVFQERPDVILCTGPGVCIPIVYSAVVLKTLGLLKTRIVFAESICRVKSLSLSGKLTYPIANDFLVQWEEMQNKFKGAKFIGRVC